MDETAMNMIKMGEGKREHLFENPNSVEPEEAHCIAHLYAYDGEFLREVVCYHPDINMVFDRLLDYSDWYEADLYDMEDNFICSGIVSSGRLVVEKV